MLAMVGRCSQQTLWLRFHGAADAAGYFERLYERPDRVVFVAECQARRVEIAEAIVEDDGRVEIALLVEDSWQGARVGTALMAGLCACVRACGHRLLRVDLLAEHAFLLPALQRLGLMAARAESGTVSVDIDLVAESPAAGAPSVEV